METSAWRSALAGAIPLDLRARQQWVCWRYQSREGKLTKVPLSERNMVNGKPKPQIPTDVTNPLNYMTFEAACRWREIAHLEGIGFVFTAEDPYCGIDLDGCIDLDGNICGEAAAIVTQAAAYVEYSPSRTGLHIILKATLPKGKGHQKPPPSGAFKKIEVYDRSRFFTFSGEVYGGCQHDHRNS